LLLPAETWEEAVKRLALGGIAFNEPAVIEPVIDHLSALASNKKLQTLAKSKGPALAFEASRGIKTVRQTEPPKTV
jgi:hypothetical protein